MVASIIGGNLEVTEDVGSVEVCVELGHHPLTPVYVTLYTDSASALGMH